MTGVYEPVEIRFWRHVVKTPECWIWTGHTNRRGYGKITTVKNSSIRVNRLSWMIHYGPIPDGMWVLHHCDNPHCVRPDHLFLGTSTDNMRDASLKGRISRGERRYNATIPDADIPAIRERFARGESLGSLANHYSVTKACIGFIVHGSSHAWIQEGPISPSRPRRKLTQEEAQDIRAIYASGGATTKELSERYGISAGSIRMIIRNKTYVARQ